MRSRGITQRVWLFLLEHGGRWTVAELAEQTKAGTSYMDKILWSMHGTGCVVKNRSGQRKNGTAFGVSGNCKVPRGVSLADIARAQAVRQVIDAPREAANQPITRTFGATA